MTKVYVYQHSFYIIGKIKDLRALLQQYAKDYRTVKELINAKLC